MKGTDIDLCCYYNGDTKDASRFRYAALTELGDDRYDIQIFTQLPLYVRVEVLRGAVIYTDDIRFIYDTALETIRDYEAFKHRLYDYTGQEALS